MLRIDLTHWGCETPFCISKLSIRGSDNGLLPGQRQAIIWTNAGILLMGSPRTNFNEILIDIHTFSIKKIHFKISSGKWQPFCLSLNVFMTRIVASVTAAKRHVPLDHIYTCHFKLMDPWRWHGIWSSLVQVMAWCLMAPSHYLNQCCLIINEVLQYSLKESFTGNKTSVTEICWKITYGKISASHRGW